MWGICILTLVYETACTDSELSVHKFQQRKQLKFWNTFNLKTWRQFNFDTVVNYFQSFI